MQCSYIVLYGAYQDFKCPRLATINDMCEQCYNKKNQKKTSLLCLYTNLIYDECFGFVCQRSADVIGICSRCYSRVNFYDRSYEKSYAGTPSIPVIRQNNEISILNKMDRCLGDDVSVRLLTHFAKLTDQTNFDMYLNKIPFTQFQLLTTFEAILKYDTNSSFVRTLLLHRKFFPEIYGYEFLINPNFSKPSQSILSIFFYKRFLIRTYLEHELEIEDCRKIILDPCMIKSINCIYTFAKFSLDILLFNTYMVSDKIINIDTSRLSDIPWINTIELVDGQLEVTTYDKEQGLYIDNKTMFISRQSDIGEVILLGRLVNGKIVLISKQD